MKIKLSSTRKDIVKKKFCDVDCLQQNTYNVPLN